MNFSRSFCRQLHGNKGLLDMKVASQDREAQEFLGITITVM